MQRNTPAAASRVDSLIARADGMSPAFVLPFRNELAPVLRYVHEKSGHWKSEYYLQLLLASAIGNSRSANTALAALRDVPDYAPFYALRASTMPGDASSWTADMRAAAEHDLRRAMSLDSMQWRYGKLLAEFHLKSANPSAAVTVAKRYVARFPSNYILGATLARSYVAASNEPSTRKRPIARACHTPDVYATDDRRARRSRKPRQKRPQSAAPVSRDDARATPLIRAE
jgi:hypothetical protein